MTDDLIEIDTKAALESIEHLREKLGVLGPEGAKQIAKDESEYFLKLMKESEPDNKYVTRKAAYGKSFQTPKQRRWFFAALNSGAISVPYNRTGKMQAGWKIENAGTDSPTLVNRTPGAGWVYGVKQARQLAMVGWRQVMKTIQGERRRTVQIAEIALRKVIKRLGL